MIGLHLLALDDPNLLLLWMKAARLECDDHEACRAFAAQLLPHLCRLCCLGRMGAASED